MVQVIKAIYEKGLLRPLCPLNLREHQTVHIQVLVDDLPITETPGEAARLMVAAGMMLPQVSGPIPEDPVSVTERRMLANLLGAAPGKPLSEIILDERGEW